MKNRTLTLILCLTAYLFAGSSLFAQSQGPANVFTSGTNKGQFSNPLIVPANSGTGANQFANGEVTATALGTKVNATSGTASNLTLTGTATASVISATTAIVTTGTVGTLTVTGSATMTGNVAIGDAAGDTLVISGSSVTAPNATAATTSAVMTRALSDARNGLTYRKGSTSGAVYNSVDTLADVAGSEITGIETGLYWVRVFTRWFQTSGTPGVKFKIVAGGSLSSNPRGIRHTTSATPSGMNTTDEITVSMSGGASSAFLIEGWLQYTAGAGTLKIQAAQGTSTAADTTLSGFMISMEKMD